MGVLIDFIQAPAKQGRNIEARASSKTADVIEVARQYGFEYWDGDRKYGYGGYHYDGRWQAVAERLITHYELDQSAKVLDVGCGKGFLVKDLVSAKTPIDAYGIDISDYAIQCSPEEVAGRLQRGSAERLPFPDSFFDLVVSFNTLHNLERDGVVLALREINRVSRGKSFVQVDSYETEDQKNLFEAWVLTAKFHDFPDGWLELFKLAGYSGDYCWTIVD
jgi:SAM-dependent methyltransferase